MKRDLPIEQQLLRAERAVQGLERALRRAQSARDKALAELAAITSERDALRARLSSCRCAEHQSEAP